MVRMLVPLSIFPDSSFRWVIFLAILGFGMLPGWAEEERVDLRFRHHTSRDGLSNDSVKCVYQDDTGFLWIGTADGLNRYDGHEFLVFRPERKPGAGVRSFSVRTIHAAADGCLWVGGENSGFSKFDPTTGRFLEQHRFEDGRTDWLASQTVIRIKGASEGRLWIGTNWGGLHRFDPNSGAMEHFPLREQTPRNTNQGIIQALHVTEAAPEIVWLGTGSMGMMRFDSATGELRRYHQDPLSAHEVAPPRVVTSIVEESPICFWITSPKGIYRFDPVAGRFLAHYEFRGLSSLVIDQDGRYWVSSGNSGLARFFPGSGKFHVYLHSESNPQSLSDNRIRTLHLDRGGMIWAGLSASGLSVFNPQREWLREHRFADARRNTEDPMIVLAMLQDDENPELVWLGTTNGLFQWDRNNGDLVRCQHESEDVAGLSKIKVQNLSLRAQGGFWIGTSSGLNWFDRETGKVRPFKPPGDEVKGLVKGKISALHEDKEGGLWFCKERGARRLNFETGEFVSFLHDPADPESIGARQVNQIHEDRAGNLWFGHRSNGLSMLSRQTGKFIRIESEPYVPGRLSGVNIHSFHEDFEGGILWVGTNLGLMRIEIESGEVDWISIGSGPANVFAIKQDEDMNLWLRTRDDIVRMLDRNSANPIFQLATGSEGLRPGAIGWVSCALDTGEFLFPAVTGVLEVRPDRFRLLEPPPVVVTDFELVGQSDQPLRGGDPGQNIVLNDSQNKIMKFKFAALDFRAPERNRFAYRLVGLEEEWHYEGEGNSATYTTLKPGAYVFRVKAANSQGVWNEEGAALAFRILPPWWATWWFRGALVAGLLLMGGSFGWFRVRQVQKRTAVLEVEIRKREKLNSELNRSEERFQNLLANSSEQVWCLEFDEAIPVHLPEEEQVELLLERTFFAEGNEALAAAYGLSREELIGSRFERVMPRSLPTTIPLFQEVVRNGYKMKDFVTVEQAGDCGERIMINNLMGTIVDGKVTRVWGTARDITRQRRAEELVKLHSVTIENVSDAFLIVEVGVDDLSIVYANRRFTEITGFASEEVEEASPFRFLASGTSPKVMDSIRAVIRDGGSFEGEVLCDGKFRGTFWSDLRISPVCGEDGKVSHFVWIQSDITARKEAEDIQLNHEKVLAHADRVATLGGLATTIAHELNQPLAAIGANAQAAQRFMQSPNTDWDEIREILGDIISDNERAAEVIRRMRNLLKKRVGSDESLDLNELIQGVETLVHSDAIIRQIEIRLILDPSLPRVRAGRTEIQQVLLNLIINGFDAMMDIEVSDRILEIQTLVPEPGQVQVSVRDRGHGLDDTEAVFEAFHTTKQDGLGMGLAIIKTIVESHGGRVWAGNSPEGGACFSFSLLGSEEVGVVGEDVSRGRDEIANLK